MSGSFLKNDLFSFSIFGWMISKCDSPVEDMCSALKFSVLFDME